MIYYDGNGYPVNETLDGYDSSVRQGILSITKGDQGKAKAYEKHGLLVRHPLQPGANNPWNDTRDNMIPMIAALHAEGEIEAIRRVFWKVVKRGFFSQSFERDVEGSKKKLYPHKFYKDSWNSLTQKRDPTTVPMWEHLSPHSEIEKRWFDWADPFLPDHMAMLIKATGYKILYPLILPGLVWLWLSFFLKKDQDQSRHELNQLFCQCYVLGPYWLKKITQLKGWASSFNNYWVERNEGEYSDFIYAYLKKLS